MISGFSPIVGKDARILILGSMPSVTSLEKQEYYGFKHNRFWKIMASYFHCEYSNYTEKQQCIIDNCIVLWDVIASCEREGSLDSAIKKVVVNDVESLLSRYPTIKLVLCNGKKSYDLFKKHFKHVEIEVISLPSTSNANRSISEEELYRQWYKALDQGLKK